MTMYIKSLALGAGFAALAAATPASAQYYPNYGYNQYGYTGYNYQANATNMAAQRCTAAVQQRLSMRGRTGIIEQLFGINTHNNARVLSVSQVTPRRQNVRVRGFASSGRLATIITARMPGACWAPTMPSPRRTSASTAPWIIAAMSVMSTSTAAKRERL